MCCKANSTTADLPTSKTCKSGDFEKKPRRLGPQTWRFPKYVLNEIIEVVDFLFQSILYLIYATYCILLPLSTRGTRLSLLFTASFPRDLSVLCFTGMRLELYSGFPQTLNVTNLAIFNTDFSILLHTI